jgi:ABC-type hemin transport system substrate-binding protein
MATKKIEAMAQHKSFVDRAEVLIESFREQVIAMLPTKGDTSETSQKIFLICQLNNLESAVNGTTVEDFIKE